MRCVPAEEVLQLINDIHSGECGHHSSSRPHAPWQARFSEVASTGLLCFKMQLKSSSPVTPANSTPSKFTSPCKDSKRSRSPGRSRSGGWTCWDPSRERSGATATSTSPSTNSPSGLRWNPCAPSRRSQRSSSSGVWSAVSACWLPKGAFRLAGGRNGGPQRQGTCTPCHPHAVRPGAQRQSCFGSQRAERYLSAGRRPTT